MMRQSRICFGWMVLKLAVVAWVAAGGSARADMVLTAAGISEGFSLTTFATNFQNNGHLILATFTGKQVWDGDPVAKTKTLLFNASLDGITIAPNGLTLYGAVAPQGADRVRGYDLRAGHVGDVVFDSGTVPGDPDGS